jgi:hypothetical protein
MIRYRTGETRYCSTRSPRNRSDTPSRSAAGNEYVPITVIAFYDRHTYHSDQVQWAGTVAGGHQGNAYGGTALS